MKLRCTWVAAVRVSTWWGIGCPFRWLKIPDGSSTTYGYVQVPMYVNYHNSCTSQYLGPVPSPRPRRARLRQLAGSTRRSFIPVLSLRLSTYIPPQKFKRTQGEFGWTPSPNTTPNPSIRASTPDLTLREWVAMSRAEGVADILSA
jgi:hypothetical protein